MVDTAALGRVVTKQVRALHADLLERVLSDEGLRSKADGEYRDAIDTGRTAQNWSEWLGGRAEEVAVDWALVAVFIRFCEDNVLIDERLLAGVGNDAALVRAAEQDYFRVNPHDSDTDYLKEAIRNASRYPGLGSIGDSGHGPLWWADPSGDACTNLLSALRTVKDDGSLALDFTDRSLDTRFLGDLYQEISEYARKQYALLQTPDFVEELILDRTLEPAIESVGLARVSLIDPACGSGHFLLGAFERLFGRWTLADPAMPADQRAARAIDAVWGVDINPLAVAIARFRLLVAGLQRSGHSHLADLQDFPLHVTVGDSLIWGARKVSLPGFEHAAEDEPHAYSTEDRNALGATFGRRYAAVVANPPYIVPKDKGANIAYRERWKSCSGKYSMGVPFTELCFDLAEANESSVGHPAGFVGMITANSFIKREMGKKLITDFIPQWDLTHVVDTSGAYIPGHGTPTVILFGRNQPPVAETVRAVQGIRGEPSTPEDPAKGLVWTAIINQIDDPGSESDYISVNDTERSRFAKHPWSIGGGGAGELKERLDKNAHSVLGSYTRATGFGAISGADDVLAAHGSGVFERAHLEPEFHRPLVLGDCVRDWAVGTAPETVFPYGLHGEPLSGMPASLEVFLWPHRSLLRSRLYFGETNEERGLTWWEYSIFFPQRFAATHLIGFAFVATHNHFVLDRGERVFKQSAPVIQLMEGATVDEHLGLLAVLNSSVGCFWLRTGAPDKGMSGGTVEEHFERFFMFNGSLVERFPLPADPWPVSAAKHLDGLAQSLATQEPAAVAGVAVPTRERLDGARASSARILAEMISAQEELDWQCLDLYGLTDTPLTVPVGQSAPPLELGERAFEIVLARKVAAGDAETAWFWRHRSTPVTELPAHWPGWYQDLVNHRIELIESNRNVDLVERAENKRRWNRSPWVDLEQAALSDWLLRRLEDRSLWFDGDYAVTRTVAQLADRMSTDEDWMSVARVYTGNVDVDALAVVTSLVADEHVPAQAAARYKPSGRKKRVEWERTWDLQRAEDSGEEVGRIAVPPKYAQADFVRPSYWKQRGKLDVPKERFTSVIGAERDASSGDSTMVLAWAGFDHAQLAQALATLLFQRQTVDGWTGEQLIPLIAALDEVLPWVEQWHPEVAPGLGQPLAAFYRGQVDQVLASIGATAETVAAWAPPASTRGRKKKTDSAPSAAPTPEN